MKHWHCFAGAVDGICGAAASANFHMHVHMLPYTRGNKGVVGGWGASAVGTEALGTKLRHEGYWETLFDFIRRENEMEVLISEDT